MDIIEELRATELPGDRSYVREARMLLGGLHLRAADEIERLREALREITTPAYEYLSSEGAAKHKIEIARAALEEKSDG